MMLISCAKNLAKTSLFSLALVLLLSSSMYAVAPSTLGVSSHLKVVSENGTQSIALYIPETNAPKVLIKIKNAKNEVLFQKRVKVENGYAKKFNLKDLKDGKYHLTITDKEKVVKQAFQITGDEILMSESEKTSFAHPTIQYLKSRKLMQVVAFGGHPIDVNVYDTKGDIIIKETDTQNSSKA